MIIAVVVVCLACSTSVVVIYDRFFAQKVVAVDLSGYIGEQKRHYMAGRLTAGELIENIEYLLRQMGRRPKNEVQVLNEALAGNVKKLELRPSRMPVPDEEEENNDWVEK